nr:hypothetical protein [Rufibacter roseus]
MRTAVLYPYPVLGEGIPQNRIQVLYRKLFPSPVPKLVFMRVELTLLSQFCFEMGQSIPQVLVDDQATLLLDFSFYNYQIIFPKQVFPSKR